MNILVFNPGSASLKFEVVKDDPPVTEVVRGRKLVSGVIEPIGGPSVLSLLENRKSIMRQDVSAPNQGKAAECVLAFLASGKMSSYGIGTDRDIDVMACRVVHGGKRYSGPVRIDGSTISAIEELAELAPLHNAGSVSVIRAGRAILRPEIPCVAVFDTSFHYNLPRRAALYAIPWELTQKHGIRRYGFHGISHNYMLLRYSELTGTPVERANIITLHLEGGSSAAAIACGKSVDTSMGFTPLEGLIMGTRSGDVDPAIVGFLANKEHVPPDTIEEWLNRKSGLLGVSGISQDTRVLVQHMATNERAELALDMFAYRVRKYVGAYLAAMGGASAVVFGGGIGENTPDVRRRICAGLECLGLQFEDARNSAVIDREGQISRHDSHVQAYVIPSEEGLMIAHEAVRCCSEALR